MLVADGPHAVRVRRGPDVGPDGGGHERGNRELHGVPAAQVVAAHLLPDDAYRARGRVRRPGRRDAGVRRVAVLVRWVAEVAEIA